jgi:hypothetical protein
MTERIQFAAISRDPQRGYHSRKTDAERMGIIAILFALLLAVGCAIGTGFFLNARVPSKSDSIHITRTESRSDTADSVFDLRQRLSPDAAIRSTESTDMSEAPTASEPAANTMRDVKKTISEPLGTKDIFQPIGEANTIKTTDLAGMAATALPGIEERGFGSSSAVGPKAPKHSKIASPRSEGCRDAACRRALEECTQLCDAAKSMAVAACPRVSSGATPQQERTCLAKRDRSRRYCVSGCALRLSKFHSMKEK